jgi:hypothetical protein
MLLANVLRTFNMTDAPLLVCMNLTNVILHGTEAEVEDMLEFLTLEGFEEGVLHDPIDMFDPATRRN